MTLSERAKLSVPLLLIVTLPAMLPVVPPLPICSVPPPIVVATDELPVSVSFAVPLFVRLIDPPS